MSDRKSCDGCDTDDYDIHTCGKGTRAEPEPPPCDRCGKPEILLGDYCQGCWEVEMERGQRALETVQKIREYIDAINVDCGDWPSMSHCKCLGRIEALLEASKEKP